MAAEILRMIDSSRGKWTSNLHGLLSAACSQRIQRIVDVDQFHRRFAAAAVHAGHDDADCIHTLAGNLPDDTPNSLVNTNTLD
jgi:hypothetical protein